MDALTLAHIVFGGLALGSAAIALFSTKGQKTHRTVGKVYCLSMLGVFLTAIPMAIRTNNLFLFLIALFSFYMAFAGWRFALNRSGKASRVDWMAVGIMIFSGLGMLALAVFYSISGNSLAVVLLVFGGLAVGLGGQNLSVFKSASAVGRVRISRHLTMMMGGTIAVITAVLVVNVDWGPDWVWWILPTAVITPFIVRENRRLLA